MSYDLLDYIISNFIESAIKRCSTKRFIAKSYYAKGVVQWSFSAVISITDLINYHKHSLKIDKLNGLKLSLHFWRDTVEEFKWVTKFSSYALSNSWESVKQISCLKFIFESLPNWYCFFTKILGTAIYKEYRLLVSPSFSNGFHLQERSTE